jgi:hypothetical protein
MNPLLALGMGIQDKRAVEVVLLRSSMIGDSKQRSKEHGFAFIQLRKVTKNE